MHCAVEMLPSQQRFPFYHLNSDRPAYIRQSVNTKDSRNLWIQWALDSERIAKKKEKRKPTNAVTYLNWPQFVDVSVQCHVNTWVSHTHHGDESIRFRNLAVPNITPDWWRINSRVCPIHQVERIAWRARAFESESFHCLDGKPSVKPQNQKYTHNSNSSTKLVTQWAAVSTYRSLITDPEHR